MGIGWAGATGVSGVAGMSLVIVADDFVGFLARASGGYKLVAESVTVGDRGVVFDGDTLVHRLEGDRNYARKNGGAVFNAAGAIGRKKLGQGVRDGGGGHAGAPVLPCDVGRYRGPEREVILPKMGEWHQGRFSGLIRRSAD